MSKKIITSFIALSFVLALVVPAVEVGAQTITDGSLVKVATSDTVYLIQGGKKLAFPYLSVYRSWGYPDNFSTVQTVSQAVLDTYPDGGYVCFRPGSLFRGTGRSVYPEYEARAVFYVTPDCKLRPVKSATVYKTLFGDPTFKNTWWVPDDFLPRFTYPLASRIESSAVLPDGLFGKLADGRYVLITNNGTTYREVTSAGISANRFVTARAA
ncbi:MAG: hypothetical protein N2259_01720, partial [Patescibacteria group bacterium]|nr:hypothetical protein [Patescibacteria group bacterium]